MKRSISCILPFLIITAASAQELNSIYDNNSLVSFDKYIYSTDSIFHTSVRPYFIPEMQSAFAYDSIMESYDIVRFRGKKALDLIFNRT